MFPLLAAALVLSIYCGAAHARTLGEIEAEAAALEAEAEGASIQRRFEILGRLQELAEEALQAGLDDLGQTPVADIRPADTPEEEIKRRREIINAQFNSFKGQMPRTGDNATIEMPEAFPLTGLIVVSGGFRSSPYRGWVWTDHSYQVVEEFVGNLIVKREYSLKQGKFTGKKNYSFDTISTDIDTKYVGGRKCLKASSGIPGHCTHWETIARSEVSDDNRYGRLHSWVILGSSEGDRMRIEAESPSVMFTSANRKAIEALGCYGAEWDMKKKEFEALLDRDQIKITKQVGSTSQSTPGCKPGSSIALYLQIKTPECHIQYTTDPTVIYGCGSPLVPPVGLKAYLTKGWAQGYKWSITRGGDKIGFTAGGPNPATRQVEIKAKAPSAIQGDVNLEVEIKRTDGTRCVATLDLTAKRPTALRRLPDPEASTFGVTPYIDFAAECAKPTGCLKSPIPIPGNPDIVEGYARISANQVLDQFYGPILRDPMMWLEKRSMTVTEGGTTKTINIETIDENESGTQIPIVPGQATPTMTMHSNHGLTEGGGLLLDTLALMYPSGTSMHPQTDFKVNQEIKIFDCPVARCVQHFKKTDATHTCQEP
ncbi:MAG: hypothetical protein JXA24_05220 [Proteobacteria bacterium]|nr:hypothetical protein [Pseudomonadota bacterium]